jgi:hypothetical protein
VTLGAQGVSAHGRQAERKGVSPAHPQVGTSDGALFAATVFGTPVPVEHDGGVVAPPVSVTPVFLSAESTPRPVPATA